MRVPHDVNLKGDSHFRNQGWDAVARDADGHAVWIWKRDDDHQSFAEWLVECFDAGLTVTNLTRMAADRALMPAQDGEAG